MSHPTKLLGDMSHPAPLPVSVPMVEAVCRNSSEDKNHAGTDKNSAVRWIKTRLAGIHISWMVLS